MRTVLPPPIRRASASCKDNLARAARHSPSIAAKRSVSASVSGWYLSHPEARYFGTGKLGRDQVVDYARRKGQSVVETERWLSSVLAYEA